MQKAVAPAHLIPRASHADNWVLEPGKSYHTPDFMIIGGMKCGTSSLGKNLSRHPEIFLAKNGAEVHFFTNKEKYARGMAWYLAHFPDKPGVLRYGDKTPGYIDLRVHERLHAHCPKTKLIIILRDPVSRFQSHYNYTQRTSVPERIRLAHARPFAIEHLDEPTFDQRIWERGLYVEQLESLFRYFPREQIHIAFLDDFKADEQGEYNLVYKFLGVSPIPTEPGRANIQDSYNFPMSAAVQRQLYERYAPYNEKLFTLLGTERSGWRKYSKL